MSFSTSLKTRTVPAVIAASVLGNLILIIATVTTVGNALPGGISSRLYLFYGVFGLCWPLFLALLVARLLRGPCRLLKQLTADAEAIAHGRLQISAEGRGAGETGLLADAMKRMAGSLNETLSGVIVSSNRLFSSEATLDLSAERLAANAGEQSEKAHQIAAAAEEMSQTIAEIARQATVASDTSSRAVKIVTEGKTITEGAVSTAQTVFTATRELAATIERLNARILEIGDFVAVIEGIADQTNLLALNAAIEAARSGEHGRGFAVVADEVRNLATKTIQATAEISAKIRTVEDESARTAASMDEASKEVVRTTESIEQVGGSLDRIADAFHEVNDRITLMAAAVEQQSATTREVAAGIENTSRLSADMGKMAIGVEQEVKVLGGITDELLVALGKLRLEAHEKTREVIEKIAATPELLSMDRPRQEAYLRRMLQTYPFIELLYVTDSGGRQVTSNISASSTVSTSYGTDGYGMDWSARPWFTGAKERSGSCITDLYRSAATDTFCFTISNLFKDNTGRPKGVLGADIDFQRLCRSI